MSAGHQVKSYLFYGKTVPASTTAEVQKFTIDNEMRLNLVVDVLLGQVAGTPALNLQDSTGLGFWNTAKSATLSASTDKIVTVAGVTWTAATHGYTPGQMVVINSTGNMPGGLQFGDKTFIQSATTNTFQLARDANPNSAPITTTDSGSGTLTATAATEATIRLNVNVAGDQAVMPLRPLGRLQAVCTGGQSVQVLDIRTGYCY